MTTSCPTMAAPARAPAPAGTPTSRRADLITAAASLALALWVTAGMWRDPNGRAIFVNSGDQALFEWLLGYGAHALRYGHNPLFTHLLNVPDGVNLAVNTSITVLAVGFAPVTWLAGASVAFLVILTLNLAATAFAWYWLFSRRFRLGRLGAAIGGVFAGFAPGLVSHANAHLNWTAQWLMVLIIWAVLRLAEPYRHVRRGLVAGLLVAAGFSVAAEALFITALAGGVVLGTWALGARQHARAVLPAFARGLGVTGAVASLLLAYPLWLHFFGPQRYHGIGFDQRVHSEDLAAFGAFPARSLAGALGFDRSLAPNPTEETTFFGVPLLVLTIGCFVALWRTASAARRAVLRALGVTALVFGVLALGPRLKLWGDITEIPLPYAALARLPIFNAALPARFALVLTPIVGLLLAFLMDRLARENLVDRLAREPQGQLPSEAADQLPGEPTGELPREKARQLSARPTRHADRAAWRQRCWIGALVVALAPLVPTPLLTVERPPVPVFFTSGAWKSYVDPGGTVVPVPLPSDLLPDGQRWQTAALIGGDEVFAIPAGFFLGPGGPGGKGRIGPVPRPTAELLEHVAKTGVVPPITDVDRAQARADLRYWRASIVVLADNVFGAKWPTHQQALLLVTTELLGPPQRVADVWLWRVRHLG